MAILMLTHSYSARCQFLLCQDGCTYVRARLE
ncbi:unnamed protein product, partial [Gulo gulo]